MSTPVTIYNSSLEKVTYLPEVYNVSYEMRANEVGKASFSVAITDSHVSEITQRRYAEIYDDERRVELFRIVKLHKQGNELHVDCEHVLATLADKEVSATLYGSAGTSVAIGEVLAEQDVVHWQVGTCGFTEQFLYEWPRGTSLLKALLDIPERFQAGYFWTFDTTSHPWTINLIVPPTQVAAYIDYGRNMKDIERDESVADLVTKLYPHGAKAGTDQIGITTVEPSGNEFITDYTYTTDVIIRHWTNQNYGTEAELYAAAQDLLAKQAQPKYKYRLGIADLLKITGESIDLFSIGTLVKVSNPDLDIDADVRVMSITKSDITGKPGDISLELANKGEEFDFVDKVNVNDLSGIDINDIPGGTPGALPGGLTGTGLTITTDYLGYHVGSAWKTYMDITGRLWADNGVQWFHWDPAATPALTIKGSVTITGGSGIGSLTDAGDLALLDVIGSAYITDLSVDKLTSGILSGQYIQIASNGYIGQNKTRYVDSIAGFYLGASGANTLFNIGDSTHFLKWTGSYLLVQGKIDTSFEAAASKITSRDLYVDASIVMAGDGAYHGLMGCETVKGADWGKVIDINNGYWYYGALAAHNAIYMDNTHNIRIDASGLGGGIELRTTQGPGTILIQGYSTSGGQWGLGYINVLLGSATRSIAIEDPH